MRGVFVFDVDKSEFARVSKNKRDEDVKIINK